MAERIKILSMGRWYWGGLGCQEIGSFLVGTFGGTLPVNSVNVGSHQIWSGRLSMWRVCMCFFRFSMWKDAKSQRGKFVCGKDGRLTFKCWWGLALSRSKSFALCFFLLQIFFILLVDELQIHQGNVGVLVGNLRLLTINSMLALMRSNLGVGGSATPHQPSGVDQGVKILAIRLQQKSKQRILRGEKIKPLIWNCSVFSPVQLSNMPPCHCSVTRKFTTSSFAVKKTGKKELTREKFHPNL